MSRRALVAEDDEPIRKLVGRVLERQGLEVHTAKNGREAIEAVRSTEFDIIVLDLMMPEVSGFEVLDYLRTQKPAALKSLIIATAVSDRDLNETLAESDEPVRVIRKPFDLDELERLVATCITEQEPHGFKITCLSCDAEVTFEAGSERDAREKAREAGWHVVSFVREETATGKKRRIFITFCPTCASPESIGGKTVNGAQGRN